MKLSCVLVVLLVSVSGGFSANTTLVKNNPDLEVYVQEAKRLFNSLVRWNESVSTNSSEEGEGNGWDEFKTLIFGQDEEGTPRIGRKTISTLVTERVTPKIATSRRSGTRGRRPFTIDDRPTSSGNSDQCLRNRSHVTAVYLNCIYEQGEAEENEDGVGRFLRQCQRTPQLRQCIKKTILERMESCLDEGMHETIANVESVTDSITKFICKHEADKIATFIQDGGLECWEDLVSSTSILVCLNANIANYVFNSLFDLPSLRLVADKCLHLDLADQCVQKQMESCKDDISVLIVGVFFSVAKQVASCGSMATQGSQRVTTVNVGTRGQRVTTAYVGTARTDPIFTTSTLEPTSAVTQTSANVEHATTSLLKTEIAVVVVICAIIIISMFVALSLKEMMSKSEKRWNYSVTATMSSLENNPS